MEEESFINISENSLSSSLLEILPSHIKFAPDSKYIGKEKIKIKTINSIFPLLCAKDDNIYLKIDTQGFEENVIIGALDSIQFIDTLELEMSLIPLYMKELLFNEMCIFLNHLGYTMVSIEPDFTDEVTGQLLQVVGIFHRFSLKPKKH